MARKTKGIEARVRRALDPCVEMSRTELLRLIRDLSRAHASELAKKRTTEMLLCQARADRGRQ